MRPYARAVVLAAVTALAVGGLAAPALAASPVLSSADPAPNSSLNVDPAGVTLTFDQTLSATSTIQVSGPSGTCVQDSPLLAPSSQLSCVFLPGDLDDGTYTVAYNADPSSGSDPATTDSYEFFLDSVPPGTPTVVISPDPVNAANEGAVTVSGTSDGTTVDVVLGDGPGGVADLTEDDVPVVSGSYSATFDATSLPDGTITASVVASDAAGNTGGAGTDTAVKDTVPPGTPTVVISPDPINAANQGAVTVSGTSNGTSVSITVSDGAGGGADLVQTATVSGGTFSKVFDVSTLDDGTITASVVASDAAGNTGAAGTDTAVKDTTPPGTPTVVISPDPINAANQGTVTVSGTSNGTSVSITVSDGVGGGADLVQTATVSGGTYSKVFDVSTLDDGTITASVVASDAAGNSSSAGTDTALKDTTPPGTPTVVISPDPINAANQGTVTVSGTSNGTSVSITVSDGAGGGADLVQTATVSGGTYSKVFDVSTLDDGTITASVVATDTAGNNSGPGTDTATKDTGAPGTPTVVISPDPINAANQGVVTVSGASTGASVSITVSITVSDGAGGGADLVQTATVSGGTYSKTFDVSTLSDGTITATVVATDAAGNNSPAGTDTATKDTVPPGTPTVVISPDPINAANQGAVTVSGNSNGATVSITVSDGAGGGADLVQTATVSGGTYSRTFDVSTLSDGTITATVVATDAAGNTGGPGTDTATKDTVPPGTPTVVISPDPINAANQAAVTVSGASTGASVSITVSDGAGGGADLVQTATVSGGTYSRTFDVSTLSDGTITATVVATDAAGNNSPAGTDTATKDTVPPGTPTVVISPDPINAANQGAVTVSGASTGASVSITVSDGAGGGADLVQTATVSGGTYSKTFDVSTLSDGTITATVVATDAAGNNSPAGTDTATKDTVPPGTPTVVISPDPINNANRTAVTVSGSSNGATVSITVSDGAGGGLDLVQTATVSGGTYSRTFNVSTLSDGTITATVVATDAAGNTGGAGTDTATKDTGAPSEPTAQISPDPINIAAMTAVTVSGTTNGASVSARITVSDGPGGGADLTQTVTVSGDSYTKTFDVSSLDEGTITAAVVATDSAGNTGPAGTDLAFKDAVAPTKTSSLPVDGSTVLPPSTVVLTFSETLATGSIAIPGVAGTSSRSGSTVTFTPAATMPEGSLTATATVTDLRGNPGSGTVSFVVDDGFATTSTTLDPIPATVSYQKTITLSGQVTRPDKSVAPLPVMVSTRDDAGHTKEIALVTPSASGAWSVLYRPTVNGTFTATYLGDRKNAASTSGARTTKVRVRLAASTKTGPATKKAKVKGEVTPAKAGAVVQLYRVGKGGTKLLGTAKVKAGGRFTFRIRLPKGQTKLQVSIGATPGNLGGSARLTAFRT